jgi:hypothetical protein
MVSVKKMILMTGLSLCVGFFYYFIMTTFRDIFMPAGAGDFRVFMPIIITSFVIGFVLGQEIAERIVLVLIGILFSIGINYVIVFVEWVRVFDNFN